MKMMKPYKTHILLSYLISCSTMLIMVGQPANFANMDPPRSTSFTCVTVTPINFNLCYINWRWKTFFQSK